MDIGTDARKGLFAVGRPVRGEFTYLVPGPLVTRLQPGMRVRLPFGRSTTLGFFLAFADEAAPGHDGPLKPVASLLEDTPALTAEIVALARFSASHYRYPLGEVLKGALPPGLTGATEAKEAKPKTVRFVEAAPGATTDGLERAHAQAAALSYLLAIGKAASLDEVELAIPGAKVSLKKLAERKLVAFSERVVVEANIEIGGADRPAELTADQAAVLTPLLGALERRTFAPFLLHGVTGSGKTEVYLRLVEEARRQKRGALVLVPEIALTPQLVGRFKARFGTDVAVLHSGLQDRERQLAWQRLRSGGLTLAVGVRSAIFAPVADLGLVVVDEEHDPSFKQEEKLRYNARDLALVRGKESNAVVVLGSATPSLETLENARTGRYGLLELPRRVMDRPMPSVELVDLRLLRPRFEANPSKEAPILSAPVLAAIGETLRAGRQTILFLNRRGHSSFVVCEVCGQSLRCEHCDVCLTWHQSQARMMCHYCGFSCPMPDACPGCHGALVSLGVGTERVETEVLGAFPEARVGRLDRDAVTTQDRLTHVLSQFARGDLDVLVGTQMVAKGHDFPGVTLVCVVLADSSLALPDFRAAERTFHLLTQVAGRAGRGVEPGRVLVQTYNPEAHSVARVTAHDFAGFSDEELRRRRLMRWPPFARLAAVRIEGPNPGQTAHDARRLAAAMARAMPPASAGVSLLGPAPAPLSRLKGQSRWQVVLKGPTHSSLKQVLDAAEATFSALSSQTKAVLDVDPGAML